MANTEPLSFSGKTVVVTGAGGGIGEALAHAFGRENARVVVSDRDPETSAKVARAVGGVSIPADAGVEAEITNLVRRTEAEVGPVAIVCSNAGILARDADPSNAASAPDAAWDASWRVNVMAHVWAARAALPAMITRREGWFLQTISAAGLLSQIGAAAYATTKHAAIGFAESLAIAHRDDGIGVSALCPQAVETAMARSAATMAGADVDGVLTPAEVADAALEGLSARRFLILPHASVAEYRAAKAADYDRWLGGMAKFRRRLLAGGGLA